MTRSAQIGNLIIDYYDRLPAMVSHCVDDPAPRTEPDRFDPGFEFPELDARMRNFLAVATAGWLPLAEYRGNSITLLDLARNPGTQTTKTLASLLIVARAVAYIRRTGEPVMLFSPTSGNKGTALRDAVLRAIDAGLVGREQLRVTTLAPRSGLAKLRSTRLNTDPELRRLNPFLVHDARNAEDVKLLGREFVAGHGAAFTARTGARLWFSLELANYLIADMTRAFFERDVASVTEGRQRLHAHAVSSAFGLLGYHEGRRMIEEGADPDAVPRPASLLVQHLETPGMVLSLNFRDFTRDNLPEYRYDRDSGLYRQDTDVRFPLATYDPHEVLDTTFYTHRPTTSQRMNDIIAKHGGGGIVVSLHECLDRYPVLRGWLAGTDHPLPADPRTLREWSLVMAGTGVLNALDRGIVGPNLDIVLHGSGSYAAGDYTAPESADVVEVRDVADIAAAVLPA